MLSYSQRKAFRATLYLIGWSNQGYFGNNRRSIEIHLNKLLNFYTKMGLTVSCKRKLTESLDKIEKEFESLDYIDLMTDSILMLSICCALGEMITEKTKHKKTVEIWDQLVYSCKDILNKNYESYLESIDKAEKISTIILNN